MKEKLLIIGASGHGKVVADVAMKMGKWKDIHFLDDNPQIKTSLGLNVIDNSSNLLNYIDEYDVFVGIGNNKTRKKINETLETAGASIPVLIHPTSVISQDVHIGKGTIIMAGAVINCSTTIGKGCIINTGTTIDHDNEIGDYVHISPGCNLAGTVSVDDCCWLGIGSVVINNVNIVKETIVGAGGVVVRDILQPGVYVGIPVRRIQ